MSDERRVAGKATAEHLRWCARCRSVVAEYEWLQKELATTLEDAAKTVSVPKPAWGIVQERVLIGQRRQVARARASALVSVALAVCLLLSAPSLLELTLTVQVLQPEVALVPTPTPVGHHGRHFPAVSSEEVVVSGTPLEETESLPTPVLVPVPTPPAPET